MTPNISPEILSQFCYRTEQALEEYSTAPISFWKLLVRGAHDHKVLPVLHDALHKHHSGEVPRAIMQYLKMESRKIFVKNMKVRAELVAMTQALSRARIPYIVYKGVPLAELDYGGIGLREFNDNDLIVKLEDIDEVSSILESLGYESIIPENEVGRYKKRRFDKEVCLVKRKDGRFEHEADVHWMLLKPSFKTRVDFDYLNIHTLKRTVGNVDLTVLDSPANFIALCVHHGINEGWGKLKYLFDLYQSSNSLSSKDDWSKVFALADELNIRSVVNATILLLKRYMDASFPVHVVEEANCDRVAKSLSSGHTFQTDESHWEVLRRKLKINQGVQKSKILVSHFRELAAPNHADQEFISLPNAEGLYWLYFLIKPLRLLVRGENRDVFQ